MYYIAKAQNICNIDYRRHISLCVRVCKDIKKTEKRKKMQNKEKELRDLL